MLDVSDKSAPTVAGSISGSKFYAAPRFAVSGQYPGVVDQVLFIDFTKGSPLGDTLSLFCEASVSSSGSNNGLLNSPPPLGIDFSIQTPPFPPDKINSLLENVFVSLS